jgi:sterol 3beta-glucosyltransferase
MKIGMQTWGTEGDARPFIALAGELQASGHEVTLAVACVNATDFTAFERSLGFRLVNIDLPEYEPGFMSRLGQHLIRERNPLRQLQMVLFYFMDPAAGDLLAGAKELCRENDLLIRHAIAYPAGIAAERMHLPCISVFPTLAPVPSSHTSPLNQMNFGKWINSLMWKLADRILNRLFSPAVNRMRLEEPLSPVKSVLRDAWFSDYLTLIAVSPTLFPPQADWGRHFRVCGFFNVPEQKESMAMPGSLKNFLDSGPPPVFMTFGSVMEGDPSPGAITRLMVDAAGMAGCRAIIQSEWERIGDIPEHPDIYRITRAAHQRIFPRCAAVVHAGGAGTTQTATRAGCPSVIVAHANDQESWGKLLKQSGIAPETLHRRSITAEKLARAIRRVLDTPEMTIMARAISNKMRNENGPKRAVELIQERFYG